MTEEEQENLLNQTPPQEKENPLSVEEELKECKEKYLRLLAESENARKRMQKEKQESIRFAVENVLTDFLGPMDNLENALNAAQNMSSDVKQWAAGFQMILAHFKDILTQNGVILFKSEGTHFDPHLHEAVETEETDAAAEGTILREFVRGYKSGNHVLRPARVKVAKPITKNQEGV